MRIDVTGKSILPILQGVLGQADTVEPGPPVVGATYQEVFDAAQGLCRSRLSEGDCYRLFGYRPFLCPPPPPSITGEWWFWTAIGIMGGVVLVKLLL